MEKGKQNFRIPADVIHKTKKPGQHQTDPAFLYTTVSHFLVTLIDMRRF